jgi:GTP-binding protein YchF
LQLKDLDSVEKKASKVEKMAKVGADTKSQAEYKVLLRCLDHLQKGKSIRSLDLDKEEKNVIADLFLLTDKPVLYVANVDEASMHTGNKYSKALMEAVKDEGAEVIIMNNSIEAQISEMEAVDDRQLFMEEYGMKEPALNRLIKNAYQLLNLETYFTAGVQEVRAWTIHKGWKAPQAASVIHTDFEKGFIKAEVISYEDFVKYGSEAACRENGRLRIEGKDYLVQDGDVMHFRFNV